MFSLKGNLLNGRRNGKGKEFGNKGLIFDGEFLNGQRWNGDINEYDKDDTCYIS